MLLTFGILISMIVFGPSRLILERFINSIGEYFSRLPAMAFTLFPFEALAERTAGWTLTYPI